MSEIQFEGLFEETGFRENETNREYHKDQDFLSCSGFKVFMKRASKFPVYQKMQLANDEVSDDLGSLFHMKCLEPEKFAKECVHIPGPMNKNPFKKDADDAKAAGLLPIGNTMWEQIHAMHAKLIAHPEANTLIEAGKHELSYRWIDPETGLKLKCRYDSVLADRGIVADIKTIQSVDEYTVQREIMKMQYHWQTAWYVRAISNYLKTPQNKFVHIFVETSEPYDVITYALDDASIERADLDIRAGLAKFKMCKESNIWPGPDSGIHTLALPSWAFNEEREVS